MIWRFNIRLFLKYRIQKFFFKGILLFPGNKMTPISNNKQQELIKKKIKIRNL